ncbi:MAG: Rid family detoxifying hydrolase [Atribacterota bacterium]|nr:Rid family detoxifying hydrolase [Atribacterota bacterium]
MSKKFISTDLALSHPMFSQAIRVGNFVYTSGQIGIDSSTGKLCNDSFEDEVAQCINNIEVILKCAGLGLGDIIKITVFVTDMSFYDNLNREYIKHFQKNPPTRSAVEVSKLAKGARVEIEAIAYKD